MRNLCLWVVLTAACAPRTTEQTMAPDLSRNVEALRASCDAGDLDTCVEVALRDGFQSSGWWTLLQRACDGNVARGCRILAVYNQADQAEGRRRQGAAAAKHGCELNDTRSYHSTHFYAVAANDWEEAKRVQRRACELGDASACKDRW